MLFWYQALIFATGAATLALEVLASRIMTPYFGVSLYIWAGILSITLTFFAVGYSFGGWLTRRLDRGGQFRRRRPRGTATVMWPNPTRWFRRTQKCG